ncbi:MAG TPA: Bipolar DNA helicase [Phycisphaerales bacterium]|nr:Bipolar DNA helicase [Phycisphaerales bacterium]HBR20908.1 Bipolar DNA helicase [Phycisphaerales bacterium]
MLEEPKKLNAEVIAVLPNKIKIAVDKLEDFRIAEESLKIGSYLKISDNENTGLIAMISNYLIEVDDKGNRKYVIEANPLGTLKNDVFKRGGDELAIPPKGASPLAKEDVKKIYESSIQEKDKFKFSTLSRDRDIAVFVNGNRFFDKHIAIVGATGSGKSCTVAKILQNAKDAKSGNYQGLNNSHIVIFDIHSEYAAAFSDANLIDIDKLVLPYWLLNSEELEELFIDTEANDHNQRNTFKEAVISSKKEKSTGNVENQNKIHYDSPLFFEINDVLKHAQDKNSEVIDTGDVYASGEKKGQQKTTQGSLYGKLTNFISRLENKINDKRLDFLLGEKSKKITFEQTLRQFLGYKKDNESNITIIDLSGIPFEVLSITVSLITRLLFDYCYYYKKKNTECETPLLLVFEEAHKYVPKSELAKYRASQMAIERVAKEGRKYGVTLLIASQRPSEISETIFSQCSNFIAMRLTNPDDQNYVKRLLPDMLGAMTETLPALEAGEALLIGDSVVMPSLVYIDRCEREPASKDIPYLDIWKEKWKDVKFPEVIEKWQK